MSKQKALKEIETGKFPNDSESNWLGIATVVLSETESVLREYLKAQTVVVANLKETLVSTEAEVKMLSKTYATLIAQVRLL